MGTPARSVKVTRMGNTCSADRAAKEKVPADPQTERPVLASVLDHKTTLLQLGPTRRL